MRLGLTRAGRTAEHHPGMHPTASNNNIQTRGTETEGPPGAPVVTRALLGPSFALAPGHDIDVAGAIVLPPLTSN